MGNAVSYIKDYGNVEFVMIIGYVQKGWCEVFVRDKQTHEKILDFNVVRLENAKVLWKIIEEIKNENWNN